MNSFFSGGKSAEILILVTFFAVIAGAVYLGVVRPRANSVAAFVQQTSDAQTLLRAISQLREQSGGSLDALRVAIPDVPTLIGVGAGEVNLCNLLVPEFLVAMPVRGGGDGGRSEAGGSGRKVSEISGRKADGAYYRSCDDYETGYVIFQRVGGEVVVR